MERIYTLPVGTDGLGLALPNGQQIAGVLIDNPSGSWLRLSVGDAYVPPYTLQWSAPFTPTKLTFDVRYSNSPSNTPSELTGQPVTVTLYDHPVPQSPGFPSGAAEFQQPGIGDKTYRFDGFTLTETLASAAVTITPPAGFAFIGLQWRVNANLSVPATAIRTPVEVNMIDGLGAALFPSAMITPENPISPFLAPTGREFSGPIEIGGIVAPGGGAVAVVSYFVYYSVRL